ncbi:MAG TPA: M48 family metallopeptidase [Spirochaetia bacterium]|nr:M48 family metallopeptidase [Spirochaetia bacterium]
MLVQRARKLPGISPRAWEHPADRAALSALRSVPGLDELVKMVVGGTTERSIRLLHVSSCVKVTPTQFHRAKVLLDRAVDILDWPVLPDVFVANNPFFNAGAYGVRSPFIVLNSAILRALTDDELYCVIAHEVGHIMSGHTVYKTVLWVLLSVSFSALPIARLLVQPLLLALKEWDRKSELSADRAALLALQSETENYSLIMKMAGGEDLSQMNINDFFSQALEYENEKGVMDSFLKLLNTMRESHPFPVVRLQELRTWASSGQYQAILGGNYPRRGQTEESAREDLKEAVDSYKSAADASGDPVMKAAKDLGEAIGRAAEGLRDKLNDRFRKE